MNQWYSCQAAGIEEYFHPFFHSRTIYSPDRQTQIFTDTTPDPAFVFQSQYTECVCAFCMGSLRESTPDKSRLISKNHATHLITYPSISIDQSYETLFRRQGNLFEVLSYDYWHEKYQLKPTDSEIQQLDQYSKTEQGNDHLKFLSTLKLKKMGLIFDDSQDLQKIASPFYSGFHELLTSGWHYCPYAKDGRLFSSASLSQEDHFLVFQMLIDIMNDMISRNKYIKFIAIFQNWLSNAGASFKHWHKQILAIDFWGDPLIREYDYFQKQNNYYEYFINNTTQTLNLVIAENQHAVAYIEIGGKTGLITICSKSHNLRPNEHTLEEQKNMSDLTHAILSCLGSNISYNEEWFYTPFDTSDFKTPWRIIIDLRSTTRAGFENITQININSISPKNLADSLRKKLKSLTNISPNIIIHEQSTDINMNYYK